jgi:ribosomal protein S18 acetylase RimI-like enzyme
LALCRRKGVGSEMMRQIIKRGEERDVHRIFMYVRGDNKVRQS